MTTTSRWHTREELITVTTPDDHNVEPTHDQPRHGAQPPADQAALDREISRANKEGFAFGFSIVAAALLFVAGLVAVFEGISAIAHDDLIVVGPQYVYQFNLTAWGWIHLVVGVLAIVIAGGLAAGADWARISAIIIAAISIVTQFLWLPHYPLWSILIIALDVVIIWAVATWRPHHQI